MASRWADKLMPLVRFVNAERRTGAFAYTKSTSACLSALLAAGRYDELLLLIDDDPRPMWHERRFGVQALRKMGKLDEALRYAQDSRSPQGYDEGRIDAACEAILVEQGKPEEAYRRFGLRGHRRTTYLATFRAVAAAYPSIPRSQVLADLIDDSPGEEGRWFAAAKSEGDLDLALRLADRAPVNVRTLLRAARDAPEPRYALGFALCALRWMCAGEFYEITAGDVQDALRYALVAAERVEGWDRARAAGWMNEQIAVDRSPGFFVRGIAERRLRSELEAGAED